MQTSAVSVSSSTSTSSGLMRLSLGLAARTGPGYCIADKLGFRPAWSGSA